MILHAHGAANRGRALGLFGVQLVLNYAWSPLFFGAHKVGLALGMIVAMVIVTAATAALFARIRVAAAILLMPYLAWLLFAAVLNYQVMVLNPNAETLVPEASSPDITLDL
jgi:tryptophan-rich sensory protein